METIDPKIDKKTLAFVVPLMENKEVWTLYLPAPQKERVASAAPVLGALFSLRESSNLSAMVLARDYEVYVKRACKKIASEENRDTKTLDEASDKLYSTFKDFLEASFLAGTAIDPKYKQMKIIEAQEKISEESWELAAGIFVFFYAVYRYQWMYLNEDEKKDISTSLSVTDYVSYMQTLSSAKDVSVEKETH